MCTLNTQLHVKKKKLIFMYLVLSFEIKTILLIFFPIYKFFDIISYKFNKSFLVLPVLNLKTNTKLLRNYKFSLSTNNFENYLYLIQFEYNYIEIYYLTEKERLLKEKSDTYLFEIHSFKSSKSFNIIQQLQCTKLILLLWPFN